MPVSPEILREDTKCDGKCLEHTLLLQKEGLESEQLFESRGLEQMKADTNLKKRKHLRIVWKVGVCSGC